ncbi:hypothetical protein PVMG_01430 [Plasmodium vivax Mauritania I]|uniref:Variable surface protein n=1 Tax=Plasmodium vivax Mauritania I TaxID=1035515 RepID=A0A0J9TCN9_PLAVI|nr:hypothetical protein PVMG_01430 [Plasmodium vivax Mauritania I]
MRDIKKELQERYYILPSISNEIVKAVCYVYDRKKNHKNDFDKEYCSYLYYWLGDKIYNNIGNKSLLLQVIKMIYDELNYNNMENLTICQHVNFSIHPNNFIINKLLFDYSKDYVNIRIRTALGNTTCDRVYKDYLAEYIRIYIDAYLTCKQGDHKKYDCDKFSSILNS